MAGGSATGHSDQAAGPAPRQRWLPPRLPGATSPSATLNSPPAWFSARNRGGSGPPSGPGKTANDASGERRTTRVLSSLTDRAFLSGFYGGSVLFLSDAGCRG